MPHYSLAPASPHTHRFQLSITVAAPDAAGQRFRLPAWVPGSYLIRDLARHVGTVSASSATGPVDCTKIDKSTWECAPTPGPLTLTYEVYANDLSPRGAFLDARTGFADGASLFMAVLGQEAEPIELTVHPPPASNWRLATAMPRVDAPRFGFGTFRASNYAELIDHPMLFGHFEALEFSVAGVPHWLIASAASDTTLRADWQRLALNLSAIAAEHARLFNPENCKPPMAEYWFLLTALHEGYGGLEHRASCALVCGRDDLPLPGQPRLTDAYRKLLSLASHEYFHAWNVKRLAPARLVQADLARESYTTELWFYEGFTSYYDDLALVRAGLIDELAYLEIVADQIGRLAAHAGRQLQSLAQASFDAWIKYYRPDENTPNAQVSYYLKGAQVALALDLTLRARDQDNADGKGLDAVMRRLWVEYGERGIPVPEGRVEQVAAEVAGCNLDQFFDQAVRGTGDLDFEPLFDAFAIQLQWRTASQRKLGDPIEADLGAKWSMRNGETVIEHVYSGSAAEAAGLAAGDQILALDGFKVNALTLERRVRGYPVGSTVEMAAFRRGELLRFSVVLHAQAATTCVLTTHLAPDAAVARRRAWLKLPSA